MIINHVQLTDRERLNWRIAEKMYANFPCPNQLLWNQNETKSKNFDSECSSCMHFYNNESFIWAIISFSTQNEKWSKSLTFFCLVLPHFSTFESGNRNKFHSFTNYLIGINIEWTHIAFPFLFIPVVFNRNSSETNIVECIEFFSKAIKSNVRVSASWSIYNNFWIIDWSEYGAKCKTPFQFKYQEWCRYDE